MLRHHTFSFGHKTCTVSVTTRSAVFEGIGPTRFFVADTTTGRFAPDGERPFLIDPGEGSKSWKNVEAILAAMLEAELTRDSTVVGLGGGVVSDIASFASSLYMRGCRLVLVPTSLLSMADAALGGKTGVNFGGFKNMIGTFYPADEVRLCPELLHTLTQREYMSGLAEVIKTAMLGDAELFDLLERESERIAARDDELLADVVWRCVMVKGRFVEEDLRETGIRAHLNLGHTFAHALESEIGLGSWSHGEAVAWGLARAMEAGVAAGITSADYAKRVHRLLGLFEYQTDPLPGSSESLIAAMRKDKKRKGGIARFVLQEHLCQTIVTELEESLVKAVLDGKWAGLNG